MDVAGYNNEFNNMISIVHFTFQ